MDQRTVHVLVHIWEPDGSPAPESNLLCLSRTKLDTTGPVPPDSLEYFRCADVSCPTAASQPLPNSRFSLGYAASDATLMIDLTSFDETVGAVTSQAVELLLPITAGASCAANGETAPPAAANGASGEWDEIIDLTTGVAPWSGATPTRVPPEWLAPKIGSWLAPHGCHP